MKTSKNGVYFIKSFESLRLKAYKAVPTEQYYTIGYGHYGADVQPNSEITESEAEELLRKDLGRFEQAVDKETSGLGLNQNQFDALVSFTFNVGISAFQNSTLLRKIKAHAPENEIWAEFLRWRYSGKQILPGLVKRRQAEADLYLKASQN